MTNAGLWKVWLRFFQELPGIVLGILYRYPFFLSWSVQLHNNPNKLFWNIIYYFWYLLPWISFFVLEPFLADKRRIIPLPFQFSKFLECLSLIKFEHHYHVKYNFENIFVKLFTELLYFCSEWSCTWMGSGHETWILCTGKTYFPISWLRFRINFLIQLLFLWDFLHWGVWLPEIASVSYLCLIIDYIKSTVPCEFTLRNI